MAPELLAILRSIADRDPDSGEREPSERDYMLHKAWAVATHGLSVWQIYRKHNWERRGGGYV